jgi:hypothetical protein
MVSQDVTTDRIRHEPVMVDEDTMRLYGVGPGCPGCGGPTHAVTADEDADRPWWCKNCNVRLDDEGDYGAHASFAAGNEPESGDEHE